MRAAFIATCAPIAAFAQSPVPPLLLPGAPEISTAHFRDEVTSCEVIRDDAGTAARRFGIAHGETHVTSYRGAAALLLISSFEWSGPTFLDSTVVLRDGLAPVWEVLHQGNGRVQYTYDHSHMRRQVTAPDSAVSSTEHTYDVPIFNFNELDALLSSVPLRNGYRAILPLYSEGDDKLEMDTVTVAARDSAGSWNIDFSDPVIISHSGIDPKTRARTRYTVDHHVGNFHARCVAPAKRMAAVVTPPFSAPPVQR